MIHVKLSASTRESQLVLRQISICHLNVNISQLSLINHSCYCKAQQEASHNRAQVFISAKRMHVTVNSKTSMGIKRLRLYLYSSRYIWKQFFFFGLPLTLRQCVLRKQSLSKTLSQSDAFENTRSIRKWQRMLSHVTQYTLPDKKKKKNLNKQMCCQ